MSRHTLCYPKITSASASSQTCFIVLVCLGFWNTPVIHGCGMYRKSKHLRHSLALHGPWRIIVFLVQRTENEQCFWLSMLTAEVCTVLIAGVLGQAGVYVFQVKNMIIQKFPHHVTALVALAMVLTMSARRFQRTHTLSGMGSLLNASKDIGMGVTDLSLLSELVIYADRVFRACVSQRRYPLRRRCLQLRECLVHTVWQQMLQGRQGEVQLSDSFFDEAVNHSDGQVGTCFLCQATF